MKKMPLAILALCCALAGCSASVEDAVDSEVAPSTAVHAVAVKAMPLRPELKLAGVLASIPENNAVLSSPISGQVKAIQVHEGQTVATGDTLVLLDTRAAESDLARARAALREAQATLALLKHGPQPEEREAARQDAASAAETARALSAKVVALQPLVERGEISAVQFEQARSAAASAHAASEAAEQKFKLLASGTRPEVLEEAAARVASAETDVAAQTLAMQLSAIQSPINGVVTELPVRLGMVLDQSVLVARVTDLSSLYAQVRIPAKYRLQIQTGSAASLQIGSSSDEAVNGTVARLGAEADPQTGDVDAGILVSNEDGALKPGLSCEVILYLPEVADALVVPVSAVANRDGEAVVTIIRENKATEIAVEIGVRTDEFAQIIRGVNLGDMVCTEGGYRLPDDSPVEIIKDEQ